MTEAPVPLAAQPTASLTEQMLLVGRELQKVLEFIAAHPRRDGGPPDMADRDAAVWRATVVTLQQHERLQADLDAATCVLEDEQAAHQDTLRLWHEAKQQHERAVAALRIHERAMGAMIEALHFYADPETYFALAVIADPPCGAFAEDFSDDHGHPSLDGDRYGKTARAALTEAERILAALDDAASAAATPAGKGETR